ncbi:MAG: phosphoribosylanthranilate isomerase, partial [Melioribacteraceae bacterium]|nr:phosphoribosylanthranilate isomerase [Melioribacteraceae bacterium]
VSEMPSGPGVINEKTIKIIARSVPAEIETFLLTSKQNSALIIEQIRKCGTNTVQIVDELIQGSYDDIKEQFPNVKIVQVIHVNNEKDITIAQELSKFVDALLLDSGNQSLIIKELGGTGRIHDWEISREIVKSVKIPVYLAGGLNHENVEEAVKKVQPFGIDLCSSVRTDGKLDSIKLRRLFDVVNSIN